MNTFTFGNVLVVVVLLGNQQAVHAACDITNLATGIQACPTPTGTSASAMCTDLPKQIDCQTLLLADCTGTVADGFNTGLDAIKKALTDAGCGSGSSRMSALLMTVILPIFVLLKLC